MGAAAIEPANKTIFGFTPKKAGLHKTKSARLPTSTEPTSCESSCAMAGLIAAFGKCNIFRYARAQVMTHHEHIEMLSHGVNV